MADDDLEFYVRAKTALADASAAVARFFEQMREDAKKTEDGTAGAAKGIGLIKTNLGLAGVAAVSFGALAVAAMVSTAAAIVDLGVKGSAINDVKRGFDDLTASAGGSEAALAALRDGTRGTVTDLKLMEAMTRPLSQGLRVGAEDLRAMAAAAKLLGGRAGVETPAALGVMANAMATGRDRGLQFIGMNIDAEKAVRDHAAALGTQVKHLDESEKNVAKRNAILVEAKRLVAEASDQELSFGDRIHQATTYMQNYRDEFMSAVAESPRFIGVLEALKKGFVEAFGHDRETQIQNLIGMMASFIAPLTYVGQAATATAGFIANAFYGLRYFLFQTLAFLADAVAKSHELMAGAAGAVSMLPGAIGTTGKLVYTALHNSVEVARATAQSYRDTAEGAIDDAMAWKVGTDALNTALAGSRAALMNAATAARENAAAHADAGAKTGGHAKTQAELDAEAKAATEALKKETAALAALGVTTLPAVVARLAELDGLQRKAVASGVPAATAARLMFDEYQKLADGARASGVAIDLVTAALDRQRAAMQYAAPVPLPVSAATPASIAGMLALTRSLTTAGWEAQRAAGFTAAAYTTLGITADAELRRLVATHRQALADLEASGTASAAELMQARAAVLEAERAAGLATVDLWRDVVGPAVAAAYGGIVESSSEALAGMLSGATSFKDGFLDIFRGIQGGVKAILQSMLAYFIDNFLRGMLQSAAASRPGLAQALSMFMPGMAAAPATVNGLPGFAGLPGVGGGANMNMIGGGVLAAGGLMQLIGARGLAANAFGGAQAGAGIGMMFGGPLGAGIGAGLGLAGGALVHLFKGRTNDTKKTREAFAEGLGYGSVDELFAALREGDQGVASELRHRALNVIGKKDTAANDRWMDDVVDALEAIKKKEKEVADETEKAAARERAAHDAVTEGIRQKIAVLDREYESLERSIADEREEAEIGVVEREARARMAEIKKERDALEASIITTAEAKFIDSAQFQADEWLRLHMAGVDQLGEYVRATFGAGIAVPVTFQGPPAAPVGAVRGSDAGGIYSSPALRVIAETKPEVVGAPDAIVHAFTEALRRSGGAGGGSTVVNVSAVDADSIRRFMRTGGGDAFIEWIRSSGSARARLAAAMGV